MEVRCKTRHEAHTELQMVSTFTNKEKVRFNTSTKISSSINKVFEV